MMIEVFGISLTQRGGGIGKTLGRENVSPTSAFMVSPLVLQRCNVSYIVQFGWILSVEYQCYEVVSHYNFTFCKKKAKVSFLKQLKLQIS